MEQETTVTLHTLPQESMDALKSAVAGHFQWRILTGGTDDQPRFVIEKQVRYNLARGLRMTALYQIAGQFQKTKSGDTAMQYTVSGQSGIPIFQAAVTILIVLAFAIFLGLSVFSPGMGNNGIGILLVGFLLLIAVVYGWFAYRNYQGHLRECSRFMEDFAEQISSNL
jgi:hypothetical protein